MYRHLPPKAQRVVQNFAVIAFIGIIALLFLLQIAKNTSPGSPLFKSIIIRGDQVIAVVSPNEPLKYVLIVSEYTENRVGVGQTLQPPRAYYGMARKDNARLATSEIKQLRNEQWKVLDNWRTTWCKLSPQRVREISVENNSYSIAMLCKNRGRANFFVARNSIPQDILIILEEITNKPDW